MCGPTANGPIEHRSRRSIRVGLILVWIGLCGFPYLELARHPSLFDDDFTRVGGLRRLPVWDSLWRPFNEHLAPLFELMSRLAWWASGEDVEVIATAFLAASGLATLATALALGAVVALETGSTLGALAALGSFCLESVAIETTLWYSASSFQWSAATGLFAWFAASKAVRALTEIDRRKWLVGSGLLAVLSPLFSAIGVLAGPLASFRMTLASKLPWRDRWVGAVVPLIGTLVYLALIVANPGHGTAVTTSVRRHLNPGPALQAIVEAPGQILIPSLVGCSADPRRLPIWLAGLMTLGLVAGLVGWAISNPERRGVLGTSLAWIVGGYALAFLARAEAGDRWLLAVGRYHLWPLLGLIAGLAVGLGAILDRLERRQPLAGWVGLVIMTGLGLVTHAASIRAAGRSYQFPGESRSIAAALRLEAVCQAESVPLDQAIRIIDPILPRWFPRPLPFHPLLYLFGAGPTVARWSDRDARDRILHALTFEDRGLIFGGLDARPYLDSVEGIDGTRSERSVVGTGRGEELTPESGRLFFVEFAGPASIGDPVGLGVRGVGPDAWVEIWWVGVDGRWSREQSVRLLGPTGSNWVNLTRLPHWEQGKARQWRLAHRGGPFPAPDRLALIFRGEPTRPGSQATGSSKRRLRKLAHSVTRW